MRRTLFLLLAVGGTACSLMLAVPRNASSAMTEDERKLATFLYDGMWDRCERLLSGVLTIEETRRGPAIADADGEHEYLIAFDHEAKCFRHDHRYGGRHVQWARTPAESLLHVAGTYVLTRDPPDKPVVVDGSQAFDLRLLGAATYGELSMRFPYDDFRKFLDAQPVSECFEEPDSARRVSWEYSVQGGATVRRTIWIEEDKGFAPIRLQVHMLSRGATDWAQAKLLDENLMEWARIGDAWVPTRCTFIEAQTESRYELTLVWKLANQPVPATFFQPEGFDLPNGTGVFNNRLDPPLLEWTVGVDMPKVAQRDESPNKRLRWVLGVSAVVVCVVVGISAVRYRWARRG